MPSGLISTSSKGMGFMSTAATSGEKGTVDSPWKELDQSMPLAPFAAGGTAKAGSPEPPLAVCEKAVGASGMAPTPWGREYGAEGIGLVWDSAKGVLVFLVAGEEALGFAAELLLLLLAVVVLVVADRL